MSVTKEGRSAVRFAIEVISRMRKMSAPSDPVIASVSRAVVAVTAVEHVDHVITLLSIGASCVDHIDIGVFGTIEIKRIPRTAVAIRIPLSSMY